MELFITNALMGFGLLAGAAPVVIHLLNRQRFKRVRWAAMHFLWAAKKKSNRILTLKELLLLLLRILILLLLALALMRMILGGAAIQISGRTKVYRIIVLDNSYSMDLADGNSTLFQRAKSKARQSVDELQQGDECSLILSSDIAQAVVRPNTADLQEIRRQIDEARLRPTGSNAIRALVQAYQLIKVNGIKNTRVEIVMYTDGTLRTWKSGDSLHALGEEEKTLIKSFHEPGASEVPVIAIYNLRPSDLPPTATVYNLSVENLAIDEPLPAVGSTVNVRVEVKNRSTETVNRVKVTLFSDGRKYEQQEIDSIGPGVSKPVQFRYLVPAGASHALRALLEDNDSSRSGHTLAFDDQRFFAFDTIEKVNVLMVDGDMSRFLLESDLGLYQVLLDPPHVAGQVNRIYNITHISDLEFAEMRVEGFDAIILANVGLIPPKKRTVLDRYIKEGGAVLLFPGDKMDMKLYNRDLGSPADSESGESVDGAIDILPALLLAREGNKAAKDRAFQFTDKLGNHPMLQPLRNSRGVDLTKIRIYRRMTVQLLENNPGCEVVLNYSDGQPALIERRIGRGRVMLLTTTANGDWNDMIQDVPGAIFCHTMMGFLIQGTGAPRNLRAGEAISIDLKQTEISSSRQSPPVARLLNEGFDAQETYEVPLSLRLGPAAGAVAVPPATPPGGAGEPVSVTPPAGTAPTPTPSGSDEYEVPGLISQPVDRVGAYEAKIKGQDVEQGTKERVVYVALSPDTEESDLVGIGNADLQESWRMALYGSRALPEDKKELKARSELLVQNTFDNTQSEGDLLKASGTLELRWLFLLIMLPALLLESFLAMYFGDYEGRFNQIMGQLWANVTGFFK